MSFNIDDIADLDDVNVNLDPNGSQASIAKKEPEFSFSDEPIKLIDFSKGFKVNPQALEMLNSIKEDIIIVSVVGKARTGKSYLMNLLLDKIGKEDNGVSIPVIIFLVQSSFNTFIMHKRHLAMGKHKKLFKR